MISERFTAQLLDSLARRDEAGAARLSLELVGAHPAVDRWSLYRFESAQKALRRVWPGAPETTFRRPLPCDQNRLEKGEIVIDNGPVVQGGPEGGSQSTFWVPLVRRSELQGAVEGTVAGIGRFRPESLDPLRVRFDLLSEVWSLAELLDERERLAYSDHLTALFNSDYLFHFLAKELPRCARYKRSVSVVFLDIDWFKRINDAHGHLVGSRVLRELGELLRRNVRESDIVVRYGGDEFVIVLPETSEKQALEIAERLRAEAQGHEFGPASGPTLRLTVSIGVAVYPRHGRDVSDLIHQSDLAMYVAKHSQKNCVRLAV